jgi:hypothetical protein
MSHAHLEVTYRHGEAFAAYLRLRREPGARVAATREVSPAILADMDDAGRPIGLELLAPASTTIAQVQAALLAIHAQPVAERDLRPLRVA